MSILASRPSTAADRRRMPCDRCGLRRVTTYTGRVGNLCRDCREVVESLNELQVWL